VEPQPPLSPKDKSNKPTQPLKKDSSTTTTQQQPTNQKKQNKEVPPPKTEQQPPAKKDTRKETVESAKGVWNTSNVDHTQPVSLVHIQQQEKLLQMERQQKEKEQGSISVKKPKPQPPPQQAPKQVSSGVWKTNTSDVKSFADILREEELEKQSRAPPPQPTITEVVRPKKGREGNQETHFF